MTYKRKHNTTRLEIIQVATRMFLEKGFTNTSIKAISTELDISTGNLTFYFPTKEHLLDVLVKMLCAYQVELLEHAADEGRTSLMALCLELPTIAAVCEENERIRDLYLAAYTHPMTLDTIRRTDMKKAKVVFGTYCPGWDDTHYAAAETLVSGIEYATLMATSQTPPLDIRVSEALNSILTLYNVPEEIRRMKIDKLLAMDYRSIGRDILRHFIAYIEQTNEHALEELLQAHHKEE